MANQLLLGVGQERELRLAQVSAGSPDSISNYEVIGLEPTSVTPPPAESGQGGRLKRAWVALWHQRRLPTEVARTVDRIWIALGRRAKTIQADGLRFRVRRQATDEHFVRDIVLDQEYFQPGYEIDARHVVIDVGGNIGAFAVTAGRRASAGRVITIEPVEDNFRFLEKNVALSGFENICTRRAAIGVRRSTTRVYLNQLGAGGHSVLPELAQQETEFEEVECITLEDVFQEFQLERCDFLKLDCEGAEFDILTALAQDLANRIDRIVVEYHTLPGADKRTESDKLVSRLRQLGYEIDAYTDVQGTTWGMIFARRATSTANS